MISLYVRVRTWTSKRETNKMTSTIYLDILLLLRVELLFAINNMLLPDNWDDNKEFKERKQMQTQTKCQQRNINLQNIKTHTTKIMSIVFRLYL